MVAMVGQGGGSGGALWSLVVIGGHWGGNGEVWGHSLVAMGEQWGGLGSLVVIGGALEESGGALGRFGAHRW